MRFGQQGTFDFFCGFYAIANAFRYLECRKKAKLLGAEYFFDVCCDETIIPLDELNRNGIAFGEMHRLVEECIKQSGSAHLQVRRANKNRRTLKTFVQELENFFLPNSKSKCAILRITSPSDHWIVVTYDTKYGWKKIDSIAKKNPVKPFLIEEIYIGEVKTASEGKTCIKPSELLLIEKTE